MFSKRKAIAYGLCLLIFGAAVWYGHRLSYPPDPAARIAGTATAAKNGSTVNVDKDTMTVGQGRQAHKYKLYQTKDGLVAKEMDEK